MGAWHSSSLIAFSLTASRWIETMQRYPFYFLLNHHVIFKVFFKSITLYISLSSFLRDWHVFCLQLLSEDIVDHGGILSPGFCDVVKIRRVVQNDRPPLDLIRIVPAATQKSVPEGTRRSNPIHIVCLLIDDMMMKKHFKLMYGVASYECMSICVCTPLLCHPPES